MTTTPTNQSSELAERGWRTEMVTQPDGTTDSIKIPLTSEEFLHPKEGYHLPNSTFHDDVAGDAKDMLTRRYANEPTAAVFRDLIIKWDIPGLRDHCPDTLEDTQTGQRLLTSGELEERVTQAEARATRLAELLRAQGINPDEV